MRLCGPEKGAMMMEKKNNGNFNGNQENETTKTGGKPEQEEKT